MFRIIKKIILFGIIAITIGTLFIMEMSGRITKNNEKAIENTIIYTPVGAKNKYSDEFKKLEESLNKIRENTNNTYKQLIGEKNQRKTFIDKKKRIIYTVEDNVTAEHRDGERLGRIPYPEEEGFVYDEKGNIINRVKISGSIENWYYEYSFKNKDRINYLEDGINKKTITLTTTEYDKNNEKIKEEIVQLNDFYEKTIIEFENGKKKIEKRIIDNESDYEPLNKIYVEVTKEYDKDEKLIKKFVLRKNKHNAIRSETNFDLIKGEILTKYYDGEKAFATVTETLIGKDRAIVKRERDGDEFVIWDFVEYGKFKETKEYILSKQDRFIVRNGEITLKLEDVQEWGTQYNNNQNGIEKINFFYEHIVSDEDSDYVGWIDNLDKIIEYNNGRLFRTWKVHEQKNIRNQYRAYSFDLKKIEKDLEIVNNDIQENDINEIMKKFRGDN